MTSSTTVSAAATRFRLLDLVAPLVAGAVDISKPEDVDAFMGRLVILLQPAPSRIVRIVLASEDPGGAPVEVSRGPFRAMPDPAALEQGIADLLAGILAGLGTELAEAACANGRFVVEIQYLTGVIRVILAEQGQTLDRGLVLGGIAGAAETLH